MRRLAALATITTAGAIAAVGLAGTASAYDGETAKGMITAPTSAYARPSIESEVLDQLDRNEEVDVLCVTTIAPIGQRPVRQPGVVQGRSVRHRTRLRPHQLHEAGRRLTERRPAQVLIDRPTATRRRGSSRSHRHFRVGATRTRVHRSMDGGAPPPHPPSSRYLHDPGAVMVVLVPEVPERTGTPVNHTEG